MPVTALPTPPSRSDTVNFATRADAFHGALPTFATELNALQSDVVTRQSAVATNATAAAASATAAQAAQAAAEGAALAQVWVSGTNYTAGQQVYSPTNNLNYRCIVSISPSTVDPVLDSVHWGNSTSGMVSLTGVETLTNKTISGSSNTLLNIPGSEISGAVANAASAAACTGNSATATAADSVGGAGRGFSVGKNVSQTMAAGVSTVTFQTASQGIYPEMLLYNPTAMYNTTANALVVPATGWYMVSFFGYFQYTSGGSRVYAYFIFHNNTTGKAALSGYADFSSFPSSQSLNLTHLMYLQAGESLSMKCNLTKLSGSEVAVLTGGSVLAAKFLGA